jgi:hypothetical protein
MNKTQIESPSFTLSRHTQEAYCPRLTKEGISCSVRAKLLLDLFSRHARLTPSIIQGSNQGQDRFLNLDAASLPSVLSATLSSAFDYHLSTALPISLGDTTERMSRDWFVLASGSSSGPGSVSLLVGEHLD